ncbi:hypothetical protein [Paenibacillus agri]|uniref:Uncharacterized protein n=1 Tax=Paenibacillus agri TaxID=2744309 RepID=A0A850ERJ2_9BACL|nr:hypothetical protein [Paenibacillus agri]NUU63828.1 hypothetical protein [Paenibacillus agri]
MQQKSSEEELKRITQKMTLKDDIKRSLQLHFIVALGAFLVRTLVMWNRMEVSCCSFSGSKEKTVVRGSEAAAGRGFFRSLLKPDFLIVKGIRG